MTRSHAAGSARPSQPARSEALRHVALSAHCHSRCAVVLEGAWHSVRLSSPSAMGRPNSIPEQVVAFSGLGLIISVASLSFSISGASPSLIFYSNSHPLSLEIPEQLHVGVFNI